MKECLAFARRSAPVGKPYIAKPSEVLVMVVAPPCPKCRSSSTEVFDYCGSYEDGEGVVISEYSAKCKACGKIFTFLV